MAIVFQCKCCGAGLEFEKGATVAKCEYCGIIQTLPRLDDDKRKGLYARANYFRQNGDFDKAMIIYEQILHEDSTDAEAYWSLVLCRYGIEYVEDPATHRRVPTVNRTQPIPVTSDKDYKTALNYADAQQSEIYKAEASAIDKIQHDILEISRREKPFDVFISYKDSDNSGQRTPDSVLAVDLYEKLTQEGFKVFCSRITLEDKIGQKYEPYIFAALNSAPVMIALGTKPEYFNAVWVRNEWSRYLNLIKNGAKKTLIPAFKDMSPYELPDEFSHLQAQDMGKIGSMQDLIRGVKKLIRPDEHKTETVIINGKQAEAAPLLKRAFMFLDDGDFNNAENYCERVLDIDPENASAYLGKLMVEKGVKRREDLANCEKPFGDSKNYKNAIRFGDAGLISELEGYIAASKDRIGKARIRTEQKQRFMLGLSIFLFLVLSPLVYYKYEEYKLQQVRKFLEICKNGSTQEVINAINRGANVNAKDGLDKTALMYAVENDNMPIVNVLLKSGADVNVKMFLIDDTPLIEAAHNGNVEAINALIDAGADVNAKNRWGNTALMEAAKYGNAETVNTLINAGADVNAKREDGKRAVDYAREKLKGTDALKRLEELSR